MIRADRLFWRRPRLFSSSFASVVLGSALFAFGCTSVPAPLSAPTPDALAVSPEASTRADELLAVATEIEPELTSLLTEGADRLDIQLYGLRFRVKSKSSLERKIQTHMRRDGTRAADVVIDDVLRYTALIEDDPPGRYDAAVADILRRADARGFAVERVKNYWPRGDTYSGINCVLSTPNGLLWELQFHTVGSLAAAQEGHHLYERFRLPTTPIRERRRLFDRMVDRWSWVIVPQGILEPHSVHAKEEIIRRERP